MDEKEKVYLFKVCMKFQKKVYREMALKGTASLHKFAETIVNAFNFQFDHCFGFYSLKNKYGSGEAYTLFYDNGDPIEPYEQSVKNSYIYNVFEQGKKMNFHFDYGDDWEFIVECRGIVEAEAETTYPKITKKQGEAPPQYPDIEDDDEY